MQVSSLNFEADYEFYFPLSVRQKYQDFSNRQTSYNQDLEYKRALRFKILEKDSILECHG